jgi:DNA-binding transcriptional MocR family regulator
MIHSRLAVAGDRIIEPMLDLARCSNLNRIIVAGANSAALMFELHRRGCVRVATTGNCGLPAGQYDVALVDWRERSIKALDTTLDWLLDFLGPAGGLVVWVDPQEPAANRKLRAMLKKHGLIVEAGTVREHGSAVLAQRSDMRAMPKVA